MQITGTGQVFARFESYGEIRTLANTQHGTLMISERNGSGQDLILEGLTLRNMEQLVAALREMIRCDLETNQIARGYRARLVQEDVS